MTMAVAGAWVKFESPEGRFSVSIPIYWTNHLSGTSWGATTKNKDGVLDYLYSMRYDDVFKGQDTSIEAVAKDEEASILKDHPETKVAKKFFKFQGFPACELIYVVVIPSVSAERVIRRLIVVNGRIYNAEVDKVSVSLTVDDASHVKEVKATSFPNSVKFFNSLKFIHPELNKMP